MEDASRSWKRAVFNQFLREGIWIAPDGIAYMGHSMRTDRYRYTAWMNWESKEYVARELYDHQTDPEENVNLAGRPEYVDVVMELEAQRREGWRSALPNGR